MGWGAVGGNGPGALLGNGAFGGTLLGVCAGGAAGGWGSGPGIGLNSSGGMGNQGDEYRSVAARASAGDAITYLGVDRSVCDCSRLGVVDRFMLTGNSSMPWCSRLRFDRRRSPISRVVGQAGMVGDVLQARLRCCSQWWNSMVPRMFRPERISANVSLIWSQPVTARLPARRV